MKKIIIFISLFLISCSMPHYTYFSNNSFSSGINTSYLDSKYINQSENNELIKIDEHHVVLKSNNTEIYYYADIIIDNEEYIYDEPLYENKTREQIGFLVINNGKLIFEEVTFLKEGDAYEPRNSLQYGKNALVTLINQSQVNFSSCCVNIFSKGSSMIHLMQDSKAYVSNSDIVLIDEYDAAFSYYNNKEYVTQKDNFIFIDNNKSKESVIFYDE